MVKKYSQLKLAMKNIKPLLDLAKGFNSPDELLRSGGFSIDLLDKVAFGFSAEEVKTLMPKQLNLKYHQDMENPAYKQKQSGLSMRDWAKTVDLIEPIDVSFEKGKFYIEDGHHRYYAAKILGLPLKVNLEIKEKPIPVITENKVWDWDGFHKDIWRLAHNG